MTVQSVNYSPSTRVPLAESPMKNKQLPDLNALFDSLKAGQMPTFLELMLALSDISSIDYSARTSSAQSSDSTNSDSCGAIRPDSRCQSCG